MAHRSKEIAKFFCGFEAFHTLFHVYLWLSGTEITAFGVTATTRWNVIGLILHSTISVALGLYGWSATKPRINAGRSGSDGAETAKELDANNAAERRTLRWVLAINLSQAALAGTIGFMADSTGLLGTALDNLADAGVYVVSLFAVGRTVVAKSRAARLSGVLLILLALALLGEVIRRFVGESHPIGLAMIITAIINAATNLFCLRLLHSHRKSGVHLKASWIFTANDMLANLGIVVSGIAVMVLESPIPDFLIGLIVVAIVLQGGWEILKQAHAASHEQIGDSVVEN